MATVTFRDETMTGKPIAEFSVPDLPSTIALRDLIRLRVREEVARHNAAPTELYQGLVRPTDAETALNGFRLPKARTLDWEKQAAIALDAFGRNGFIVLVGERQVDDPGALIDLDRDPAISFVKLVPLVGG
ncbi:hypothetical protein Afil01_46010 [Actinorhabdospora filicis]|uniref:Uncharacterized protein n=1 Tax=Actinorhabdospora filicis TaxID=1785913 RepID=A0A9W6SPT4_9ACTN|nr:hypothetical protein [Actinorhabdospora filicis]GLZ79794.1 hypothetical protein Afil01_46010 [Actinorhabdospora filicis]